MDLVKAMNEDTVRYELATDNDLHEVRALFREYAESLDIDISFQDFDHELETLPGKYKQPEGAIMLAKIHGRACGCVAFRKIDAPICEMKRLYTQTQVRGLGIGSELVRRIIDEARSMGYHFMRLDTLPSMKEARRLYEKFGFYKIKPYVYNPIPGAIFLEKDLWK